MRLMHLTGTVIFVLFVSPVCIAAKAAGFLLPGQSSARNKKILNKKKKKKPTQTGEKKKGTGSENEGLRSRSWTFTSKATPPLVLLSPFNYTYCGSWGPTTGIVCLSTGCWGTFSFIVPAAIRGSSQTLYIVGLTIAK